MLKKLISYPTKATKNEYGINLDLTYITNNFIVCSFPTAKFPQKLFRNSFNDLINYLNIKHTHKWLLINLRAEDDGDSYTTGLPNVIHIPWIDHEVPPFGGLIQLIKRVDSFLRRDQEYVVVIHCKMGKGRSGLVSIAYIMLLNGYSSDAAEKIFTSKRMRKGFGEGVSIKSQRRYIGYMSMYKDNSFVYKDPIIDIKEIVLIEPSFQPFENVEISINCYESDQRTLCTETLKGLSNVSDTSMHLTLDKPGGLSADVRISITSTGRAGLVFTTAYLWFNAYWESKHCVLGSVRFDWKDFDGYKGLDKKGFKLFNHLEVRYTIQLDTK